MGLTTALPIRQALPCPGPSLSRRAAVLLPTVAAAALLAGCGSFGGLGSWGGGPPSLDEQRSRLQRELAGTPVVVAALPQGGYRVEVPLRYAHDPRRSAVKPPLAAVLDRMADGLRQDDSALIRVAGPTDGGRGDALARDRAESARDYLVLRGVARERFAPVGRAAGEQVEIMVTERRASAGR